MNDIQPLIDKILRKTQDPAFGDYLRDLLVEICKIDTSPFADVSIMRDAEAAVFDILERELAPLPFLGARRERHPVNPAIAEHRFFSKLHFTKTEDRPEGLSPEDAYDGRTNLLYIVPGAAGEDCGEGVAVNAHIDVVKPYFPPTVTDDVVYGRGAADDKGSIVGMIGAFKILSEILADEGLKLKKNLVGMMVVEEETGGNGSLSLAIDEDLKKLYDTIMVMEITDNLVHPANRGAVWYRADLRVPGVNLFELFAFVNEEFEKEGRAIRAESRHQLFPQRPVQTCHGIIGSYGEHPSRICGEVSFNIDLETAPEGAARTTIEDAIQWGLDEYVAAYGDKTKAIDPDTNQPKVDHHLDIVPTDTGFRVDVHGSTGHMGAILENDGAITKMATIVRSLVRSKAKTEKLAGSKMVLSLTGNEGVELLTLEGGQGFVPTHDITEVMDRVARAGERGAENYLRSIGRTEKGAEAVEVTYDKLHNAAFDGDPDSVPMQNAIAAAKAAGTWRDEPIIGWTVSCDARLFATQYPGLPVLTCGAGLLTRAHSDEEQLTISELRETIAFLAIYLLRQAEIA